MVGKLMKYDLKSLLRSILPFLLLTLGAALLVRFVYLFEKDTVVFSVVGGATVAVYAVLCVACLVMTFVFVLMRYYKNLFSVQGYLTFSLPAKPYQHILSKLFSSFIVTLVTVAVLVLSLCLATMGELTAEIFKVGCYIVKKPLEEAGGCTACYISEIIVLILIFILTKYTLFFACISIGQRAKKKVLASFGAYFVYYFARQIIGVAILGVFSVKNGVLLADVATLVEENITATLHIVLWGLIIIEAVFGIICALVSKRSVTKHLNLE